MSDRGYHALKAGLDTRHLESLSNLTACFTKVKQVFLLYLKDSLVTLELISLILLVGTPKTDPLAVKLLNNRLYMLTL